MRRSRPASPPSPYRALAYHHGPANSNPSDSVSLIRSFDVESNPTRPVRPSPLTASTIRDMPLDLVDRIRSFPLFMSAPDDFLAAIGNHLKPQVHSAHDHILTEGDEAKAMYWLVRGAVAVTSRDGEAVYAELKPGSFFGEIGILMNIPRTATIIARTKCLLVVLKKEDLAAELPRYPDMEKAIMQEAQERLAILNKKREENRRRPVLVNGNAHSIREAVPGEVAEGESGAIKEGNIIKSKKRKSPSPGAIEDPAAGSALGSGFVNVRKTLKELPLFSTLPSDTLHSLGLSAQPKVYTPFTDIVQQGSRGNDIFFIIRGEVEVVHEELESNAQRRMSHTSLIRPRLRAGQYFGEVASLGLSEGRTATVRSITTVECLMITGEAMDELWAKCPPEIRLQVEDTARKRLRISDDDVDMVEVGSKGIKITNCNSGDGRSGESKLPPPSTPTKQIMPQVSFTTPSKPTSPSKEKGECMEPSDPDPFLSVDMENMRNRRRNSMTPPTTPNGMKTISDSPIRLFDSVPTPPDTIEIPFKRPRIRLGAAAPDRIQNGCLSDTILSSVFQYLPFSELLRLRAVSQDWRRVLCGSPKLCRHIDLNPYNRHVTDSTLTTVLAPFIGQRPITIDISNCFHLTDHGFSVLSKTCGRYVKEWKMRSVWDVSANQILDMTENAKELEEIDWSNCRKVGDNLLVQVVGWVVPEPPPTLPSSGKVVISNSNVKSRSPPSQQIPQRPQPQSQVLAPGTVVGCPKLRRLNLSYCKHITDRSMAHLAFYASDRLERLSLTRCTSITDAGFQAWALFRFTNLTHLELADCTYLTDNSILALVSAGKNLTHLDLSFCCALSDTATEVVALGLPRLVELRLAFCGSAVSDASLGCIALHLSELEGLSVRGCVRVTGVGVESVLDGCSRLRWFDVSQCRNLDPWLRAGGVSQWGFDERGAKSPLNSRPGGMMGMMMAGFGIGGGAARSAFSGMRSWSRRGPVRFVVEKGPCGLR